MSSTVTYVDKEGNTWRQVQDPASPIPRVGWMKFDQRGKELGWVPDHPSKHVK